MPAPTRGESNRLAVRVDGPAEAVLEVAQARLADPVVVSALGMLGGRRIALGEHLRMLLDELPGLRREVGVHELRRAELTVIVLPGLAVDAAAPVLRAAVPDTVGGSLRGSPVSKPTA